MPDPKLPETPPDPSDGGTWRERAEQAEGDRDALRRENERLRTQVDRLKRQLDAARRAGYRQAAPFAKPPKRDPQRPGRKAGPAYGRPARRRVPAHVDDHHDAPLPATCPACQAPVVETGVATQYQEELPIACVRVRAFHIHVGRCQGCGQRVQGRHPLQTSDALGAAAAQLGPQATALGVVLNKQLGLSFGKVATLLQQQYDLTVTRSGLVHAVHRAARQARPTYDALCATVRGSPMVTPDETGWKVGGQLQWLWVFATPTTTECTGRRTWPTVSARELWCIVGRRGGKSRIAALFAVDLACFRDYHSILAPGERGLVMLLAADRRQARVLMGYISAFLDQAAPLKAMIASQTKESIDLTNGITIEIHTSSYRAVRGYTVVAAVLDELAFWPTDDSANPDTEILNALRPAMATVPGALLLSISSPYARRGELWRAHEAHYGKDGDPVLVWQAPTLTMHPTLDPKVVADAYADDPAVAAAEYGAEFRSDLERIFTREILTDATILGLAEAPPVDGVTYAAFVDPSGGSADAFTLAIAHPGPNAKAQLDLVRERRPPFSPAEVVREFAGLLARYHVTQVTGDRYGGEWVAEAFAKHDIDYKPSPRTKSQIYAELLPRLNAGKVQLLEHPRLLSQLANLERRTARGGRDSIDHPRGAHDDLANSAAGALLTVGVTLGMPQIPETFTTCYRAFNIREFSRSDCFLFGGPYFPSGDAACRACVGWQAVKVARKAHAQETGENIDHRTFYRDHMRPNHQIWLARMREQLRGVW